MLSGQADGDLTTRLAAFVGEPGFFKKFVAAKAPVVRRATYNLIGKLSRRWVAEPTQLLRCAPCFIIKSLYDQQCVKGSALSMSFMVARTCLQSMTIHNCYDSIGLDSPRCPSVAMRAEVWPARETRLELAGCLAHWRL